MSAVRDVRAVQPPTLAPRQAVIADLDVVPLAEHWGAELISRQHVTRSDLADFLSSGFQDLSTWRQVQAGVSYPGRPLFDLTVASPALRPHAARCWLYRIEVARQAEWVGGADREGLVTHGFDIEDGLRKAIASEDSKKVQSLVGDVLQPFLIIDERADGFHGVVRPGHLLLGASPRYHVMDSHGVLLRPQREAGRGMKAPHVGDDLSHMWIDCSETLPEMPMTLAASAIIIAGNLQHPPHVRMLGSRDQHGGRAAAFFRLMVAKAGGNDFIPVDVKVYGRQAELVGQYLVRNSPCVVDGDLYDETFINGDGRTVTHQVIRAKRIQFLGSPRQTAEQAQESQVKADARRNLPVADQE